MATIKRAIKNNQTSVKIFGTAENRGYIYTETSKVLSEAGFDYDGDGFTGEISLFSTEEWEEELSEIEKDTRSPHDIEDEIIEMQIYGTM